MGDSEVPVDLPPGLESVFLTERRVQHGVRDLAETISKYRRPIRLVPVMTAAMFMVTDMMKYMTPDGVYVTPVYAHSHESNMPGVLSVSVFPFSLRVGTTVIVDTVVDTGRTISAVAMALAISTPIVVALIVKPDKMERHLFKDMDMSLLSPNYPKGDPYLVGYGLDDDQQLRALPYIGVKRSKQPTCETCGKPGLIYTGLGIIMCDECKEKYSSVP